MINEIPLKDFAPPPAKIAFFDLDDTITDRKTDWLWAKWRASRHPRGIAEMLKLIPMYSAYRNGTLTPEKLLAYHKFRAGKTDPLRFKAKAQKFFFESGEKHIYKEAIGIVRAQKEKNCKVAIITAQHDIIAAPFANRLGMDDLIANHMIQKEHSFGENVKPYCYREGKVYWAEKFAKSFDCLLSDCAFYSDSINDRPLLEMVGFPVVVNPDILLENAAAENNWPVIRFSM